MESKPTSVEPPESQSGAPPAHRLVIRVKLTSEEQRPAPVRRRWSGGALLLALGTALALLTWAGVSMFRTDPASPPPVPAPNEPSRVVNDEPVPKPVNGAAGTESAEVEAKSPAAEIKEVIPDVPRSARETIRGTIRVTVRVIVDKEGAVLAATADDPGPSRYFERLAVEAAKQWMFAPAGSQEQRIMVVTFNFKRAGTTARASPYSEPN